MLYLKGVWPLGSSSQSLATSLFSALMSVKEMAKGITYDDPIKTRYVFLACGKSVTLTWDRIWGTLAGTP